MKNRSLFLILLLAVLMPWAANAQTVTIGTGTSTQNMSPMANYYDLSFTEMIYTAEEIAAGNPTEDNILSVGFQLASNGLNNKTYSIAVYMKNYDADEFGTATFVSFASTDAVFTGTVTATTSGWVTIDLDSPFAYDNTKNLLIGVNKTAGGYAGQSFNWNYTSTSKYQHLYKQQDGTNVYDPTNPPTSPTRNYYRPNVQLTFGVPPTCFAPKNLTCTEYTATSATLTWQRHTNGTETAWVLQYSEDNTFATGVQSVNVNTTPSKELTGLTAEHTYYARVRPDCDENLWSDVCEFKPSAASCNDIGTGTSTAYLVYTSYGCTYSQHIYTADELTDMGFSAGDIVSVSFFYSGTSSSYSKTQSIYMGTTTKSSYSGGNASDFESDVTLVYGPELLSYVAGWREYELTEPFTWDGTSNIVVGMLTNSTQSSSNGWSAYGTSTSPDYRTIYRYRDSTPIDITDLASVSNGTRATTRPNIHLCIAPSTKPCNLTVSGLSSSGATLAWDAPAGSTPTGYEYQCKSSGEWPTTWTSNGTNLTVTLSGLTASTPYAFRVRATYAESNSDPVETTFTTLDDCAFPTNLVATTTPGQGTKATLTWVKGYDEEAWVLQYGTNSEFAAGTYTEVTTGFTVEGNNVTANLTGLTPETDYYAQVMANCDGPTSAPSNVAEFTPTNYKDFTFGQAASSTSYYVPFYGSYASYSPLLSQFIIPSSNLADMAGGTIRRMTFYSSTASANWGTAEFSVYVKEVEATTFASSSATGLENWSSMTNVYNGRLSISGNQMVIEFENNFAYNGGNLMIGFNETTTGTAASASWYYVSGSSNSTLYAYYSTYSYSAYYSRGSYLPKVTFNYRPTATPRPIITEPVATTDVTATIAWTKPADDVTGYKYQYKLAADTWTDDWTTLNDANAVSVTVPGLTPNSEYNFQMKAVYAAGESFISSTSFTTQCPATTAVPYKYGFETAPEFNCWEVATGSSVTRQNSSSNAHNSNWYMRFGGNQTNEIAMPSFNQPTNTLRLEFWVRPENYTSSSCGSFAVGYYNANNEFVALKTYAFNSTTNQYDDWESSTYKKERIEFDVDADNNGSLDVPDDAHIVFRQFNTTSNYWWFVDDVKVKVIPTCEDVDNVHYEDYTNHSATIAWTADAGQTAWQIAYKAGANFNPNNATELATATVIDVTENPYLFDKALGAETHYYMYVRGNCTASSNGYGDWSDTYADFTTLAATPAPSAFTASNLASRKVDLKWVEGGGDYETSWDLYYVASETAPEAPTTQTHPTETVTTMPTPEAPYVLNGLEPETQYYIWVRANHGTDGYSEWVALEGDSFTTLPSCPTPSDPEYDYLTSVSAYISWTGSDDVDSYTIEYGEEGTYSVNETEDFSGQTPAGYSSTGELPDGWYSYNTNSGGYLPHVCNDYAYGNIDDAFGTDNILIMTTNATNSFAYAIMPQVSDLMSLEFKYEYESTSYGTLTVGYVTDNTGYSTYVPLQTPSKTGSIPKTYSLPASDIATINNAHGYVAFRYESGSGTFYSVGIDDVVTKGGTYTPAPTQTVTSEEQFVTLTNLTPGKTYIAKVKSNCTNGEWSDPVTFTTLAEGNMVFTNATTDGKWGTAGNWVPAQLPVLTDEVILRANATIESGCVAQAKKITFEGTPTPTLTIADGGQLITNTAVTATVQKVINAHGATTVDGGWYFIASPINNSYYSATSTGLNLITDNYGSNIPEGQTASYDLYSFLQNPTLDENSVGNEWRNYRKSTFSLANGKGYLYASLNGTTLNFSGSIKALPTTASQAVSLTYASESTTQDMSYRGWNLVGNPFTFDTYVNMSYYKMNEDGSRVEPVDAYQTTTIAPCTGIMVQATESGQSVTFSKEAPSSQTGNQGNLNIALAQANVRNNSIMDKAILSFNEGSQLSKFYFGQNKANIYFPQDNEPLAIVSSEGQGEMPLNFKAYENGSYTLSFGSQNASFNYLHLIDNLTGTEVDLLQTPSYTFNATTTDYESRFKLVFCTGVNDDSDSFAFCSNGNWIINNPSTGSGSAILQVIDVTGRILSSETVNGSVSKAIHAAPGVYMLRLINGDNVKVQKIVVR